MPEDFDEQEPEQGEPTRPFWSGTITFGLVSIPVSLYPANRNTRVAMRMLGPRGTPLARRYYAPSTGEELTPEEMVRGYEIEKDRYVVVSDDELERLAPEKSRDINLQTFVPIDSIPPFYFDRSYILLPAGGSDKAYRLLAKIMEKTRRAGIATFVMRGKEYLVAILAENGILRAETLRFPDEIRSPKDIGLPELKGPEPDDVNRFSKQVAKLAANKVGEDQLRDDTGERLLALARKKESRHQDVVRAPGAEKEPKVVDILSVLQQSLARTGSRARQQPGKSPRKRAPANDLSDKSRAELYERAKDLNISGRSQMSKEELIRAIQRVA